MGLILILKLILSLRIHKFNKTNILNKMKYCKFANEYIFLKDSKFESSLALLALYS